MHESMFFDGVRFVPDRLGVVVCDWYANLLSFFTSLLLICFLFSTFLCIPNYIAARYADPERIIYPSDSKGRICGRNELA